MIGSATLRAEYRAALEAIEWRQAEWLARRHGISMQAYRRGGGFGTATVCVDDRTGTFEPVEDEAGAGAVILGVWSDMLFVSDRGVENAPDLVDLVAWDPRRPDCFWRRAGVARFLGEWNLECPRWGFDAEDGLGSSVIRFVRSPLAWLQSDCEAVCLLEPAVGLAVAGRKARAGSPYLRNLFGGLSHVVCDDDQHGLEVLEAVRRRPKERLPEILVADPRSITRDETDGEGERAA